MTKLKPKHKLANLLETGLKEAGYNVEFETVETCNCGTIKNCLKHPKKCCPDFENNKGRCRCRCHRIVEAKQETRGYAQDWLRVMWELDVIDHEKWWDGLQEAEASLDSYLEGNHKTSNK